MKTGTSQNKVMSDGIHHVGRNENVTNLATCQNHKFLNFNRKVIICINGIDNKKEFTSVHKFVTMERLIKIPSDMLDSVRHDQGLIHVASSLFI